MTDLQTLETRIRELENENRTLKATLWDQYFCVAASAHLQVAPQNEATLQAAAVAAEEMLKIRKGRWS